MVVSRRFEIPGVALAFVALTAIMTWPHVTVLSTHAPGHQDIYFNLWRLRWIAHALVTQPIQLFHGNIFHPEPLTLTLSDAILVEGLIAAPLFWVGLPPVLVHNLVLWAAIAGSAVGIYVLARELTGSRAGAFASGVIFAFAPYRFDHYMHMELQWAVWIPWAFWALHRTVRTGAVGYGALTGAFIGLQMLSCIYYGLLLAVLLPPIGLVLLVGARRNPAARRAAFRALPAGVVLAAVICGAYAVPYLETKQRVGDRGHHEIHRFSARPSSYLSATPENVVWGDAFGGRSRPERRLFPGALALLLAFVGLTLRPAATTRVAYLVGLAAAFELSLGFSGYSFPFLREHVPAFQGLRAMARAGLFVLFFVAVLAAYGLAFLSAARGPRARRLLAALVVVMLLGEYRVQPLDLVPYPNEPPPLHAWLAQQPRGVVVEVPMPLPRALPGEDPRYSYLSTFHWHPILNGYSGFYPRSYLNRAKAMRDFPAEQAVARLRAEGAQYLVVHLGAYPTAGRVAILDALTVRDGMAHLASFRGADGPVLVFAVR